MRLAEISGFNFADYIGKGALLTAVKEDGTLNTMTVSWGTQGILWNREVCTVFVRPQRYTFEFCESENATLTLSFFGNERRDTLNFCGTKSGRDVNKTELTGLTPVFNDDTVYFEEARLVFVCKKQYVQRLEEDCFIDKEPLKWYADKDYHYMTIGKIEKVLVKE